MSTDTTDLWPSDIATTELKSPVAILREQGALLAQKTDGMIVGKVLTGPVGQQLQHTLRLVVPALEHYTYDLFHFTHGPSLYPVDAAFEGKVVLVESEEEFVNFLREVFASEATKQTIRSLVAHARS